MSFWQIWFFFMQFQVKKNFIELSPSPEDGGVGKTGFPLQIWVFHVLSSKQIFIELTLHLHGWSFAKNEDFIDLNISSKNNSFLNWPPWVCFSKIIFFANFDISCNFQPKGFSELTPYPMNGGVVRKIVFSVQIWSLHVGEYHRMELCKASLEGARGVP